QRQVGKTVEVRGAYDFSKLPKRCLEGARPRSTEDHAVLPINGENKAANEPTRAYRFEFYKSREDASKLTPEEKHWEECRSKCGFQDEKCADVFENDPLRVHPELDENPHVPKGDLGRLRQYAEERARVDPRRVRHGAHVQPGIVGHGERRSLEHVR
ncbi:unnamed protein product, partial [Amoebophrya sp. A120]